MRGELDVLDGGWGLSERKASPTCAPRQQIFVPPA